MVAQPEKVRLSLTYLKAALLRTGPKQWVNDIADAGGALYCFHFEATCMYKHVFSISTRL